MAHRKKKEAPKEVVEPVSEGDAEANRKAMEDAIVQTNETAKKQAVEVVVKALVEQDTMHPAADDTVKGLNMGLKGTGEMIASQVLAIRAQKAYTDELKRKGEEYRKSAEAKASEYLDTNIAFLNDLIQNDKTNPKDKMNALKLIKDVVSSLGNKNVFTINIDNRKVEWAFNPKDWALGTAGEVLHIPTMEKTKTDIQVEGEKALHPTCIRNGCFRAKEARMMKTVMSEDVPSEPSPPQEPSP